jgi:uncharacterized membrane protein
MAPCHPDWKKRFEAGSLPPMLKELRRSGRWEITLLLSAMAAGCFALSMARFGATHSRQFLFLNWNLFLAFLPWLASSMVMLKPGLRSNKFALAVLLGLWILFFPNSPYILTDLFHLGEGSGAPLWFDLVLILAFAWTGLSYGFISLLDIEALFLVRFRKGTVVALTVFLLFLSGFGIYLGRYLRWNSWDIIHSPSALLLDVGDRVANPFSHSRTWGVTLTMGLLLNMMYWTLKAVRKGHAPAAEA